MEHRSRHKLGPPDTLPGTSFGGVIGDYGQGDMQITEGAEDIGGRLNVNVSESPSVVCSPTIGISSMEQKKRISTSRPGISTSCWFPIIAHRLNCCAIVSLVEYMQPHNT